MQYCRSAENRNTATPAGGPGSGTTFSSGSARLLRPVTGTGLMAVGTQRRGEHSVKISCGQSHQSQSYDSFSVFFITGPRAVPSFSYLTGPREVPVSYALQTFFLYSCGHKRARLLCVVLIFFSFSNLLFSAGRAGKD